MMPQAAGCGELDRQVAPNAADNGKIGGGSDEGVVEGSEQSERAGDAVAATAAVTGAERLVGRGGGTIYHGSSSRQRL
jgi:hypothetical protein